MALPTLEPIRDEDLPAFCQFLTDHLYAGRSAEQWAQAFRQDWGVAKPNNGFLIRDQGRIVGGIGAIYAERLIRGRPERFCNITSWCVLEAYRAQSMRLAMAVVSQPGFHFTDLTPTEVVSKTLQFLKFKPMNERHAVWPNFPWPFSRLGGARVIADPDRIEEVLAASRREGFPRSPAPAVAASRRGGPSGGLLPRGLEAESIERHRGSVGAGVQRRRSCSCATAVTLGAHLLRQGCLYTRVESRLLPRLPMLSRELAGFRNKVFRSDTLTEADISNLYSEIVALDL